MKEEEKRLSRRTFLSKSLTGSLLAVAGLQSSSIASAMAGSGTSRTGRPLNAVKRETAMKLGLVTYNLAKDWDLDTMINRCEETGFQGVELRTTHAHKVESNLSSEERKAVRARFEASKVILVSLGTAFEFHSPDEAALRKNIDGTKEYLQLARDLGCRGVKVRPNGLPKQVPVEKTLRQIGESLRECGQVAEKLGVEIWLEVHGQGTSHLPHIRTILDISSHPWAKVCWNSNPTDVVDGSVSGNFELVKDRIGSVHMRDLNDENYPYIELFGLLKKANFGGFCFAEIPESLDPVRVMRYYKALWELMVSVGQG